MMRLNWKNIVKCTVLTIIMGIVFNVICIVLGVARNPLITPIGITLGGLTMVLSYYYLWPVLELNEGV